MPSQEVVIICDQNGVVQLGVFFDGTDQFLLAGKNFAQATVQMNKKGYNHKSSQETADGGSKHIFGLPRNEGPAGH